MSCMAEESIEACESSLRSSTILFLLLYPRHLGRCGSSDFHVGLGFLPSLLLLWRLSWLSRYCLALPLLLCQQYHRQRLQEQQ